MNIIDPLASEERELARLLGRPGRGDGPGAALDARVLAMAQQGLSEAEPAAPAPVATALPPARIEHTRHRRRRMASSLAVAASLVLVVGLAWQLRPTTPPAMPVVVAEQVAAPAMPTAPASLPAPATAMLPPMEPVAEPLSAKSVAREQATKQAAPAAARAAIARDAGSDVLPPPSPPSPPAPPAPVSPAIASPDVVRVTGSRLRVETAAAPTTAAAPAALAARAEADLVGGVSVEVLVDAVETDALLSKRDWLKRIRERHVLGDDETARASLRRFVQEHPRTRIPRDLRPLLADAP